MVKRITFKTGPLKGKTYDLPANATRHNLAGGWYEIDGYAGTWCTDRTADEADSTAAVEHSHKPVQHRDGKEAWCKTCGLNKNNEEPASKIPTKG